MVSRPVIFIATAAALLFLAGAWLWWGDREAGEPLTEPVAVEPSPSVATSAPVSAPLADLPAQLNQVQEALSRLQQNADPKGDPMSQWPPERLERELAGELKMEVTQLRPILEAGRTSLDALLQGQALLASGKSREAAEKFDVVLTKESEKKRLGAAYSGKAQAAFAAVKFEEARPLREKAAALIDKTADPLGWASAQFWIAYLDRLLARYREAEPLLKEVVRLRKQYLGPSHPEYAAALNELALGYMDTNRLAEAEPILNQVRSVYEQHYGLEHVKVATSLGNLAVVYQQTNRLPEAESLEVRAWQIDEKILGPDHPRVATRLNNLAQLYKQTNRFAEAEPLLERALRINEQKFGPEHPKTAGSLSSLADLYRRTRRLAEAQPLLERALGIDERTFGPAHPKVASDLNNLGSLYLATQRLAEAATLLERALSIHEKTFGPVHPNVGADLNNLAQVHLAAHRLAEAEPLMARALHIAEQSHGPDHPDVATALNNLAMLYADTNRLAEAESHGRRAVLIGLKLTYAAGHVVGNVRRDIVNYRGVLRQMAVPDAEVSTRFAALGQEAGFTPAETQALLAQFVGRTSKP